MIKTNSYIFVVSLLLISCAIIKAQTPLTVYTGENFTGESFQYNIVTPHKDLGDFDNTIKSFTLQDGYMATFASSSDGTGYSRVYIADGADLQVAVMPPYLYETVSFIRTLTFHPDVHKRGWCGTGYPVEDLVATNSSWFYNWDTGVNSWPDFEYVPMRHNLYWADFTPANTYDNYTHFLGYNEPSHTDQANMTAQQCIDNWKYFMESGLRLGSIAPDNPFNPILGEFMSLAEAENLRVDFIPVHFYNDKFAWQWEGDLTYIWNLYQRPIWITEGNQGANWTTNSFPVDDPNLLNDANANFHRDNIQDIINVLESLPFVERYSLYNWVEPRRSFIINIDDFFRSTNPDWANYAWLQTAIQNPISSWVDASGDTDYRVLTPAGVAYANTTSNKAYDASVVYTPTWTPFQETLSFSPSVDFEQLIISWEGRNGELINNYTVQKKNGFSWSNIYSSSDYTVLEAEDLMPTQSAEYRIRVTGKDGVEVNSPSFFFVPAAIAAAPTNISGTATSARKINLTWTAASGAQAYNVKRAMTSDGVYETVGSYVEGSTFLDVGLTPETSYYYKLSSVNTGGESPDSSPAILVTTPALVSPTAIQNIRVGSGDGKVKLLWDPVLDSQFEIKRSLSSTGPFSVIATTTFDSTEYTDLSVTNGDTFYYKINAFNDAGASGDSYTVTSNPDLGQHLYYDFNTTEIHDQWGLFDASVTSSSSEWITAYEGNGLNLNGTNTFVDIADGVVGDLTDFTIASWVKLDQLSNWARIFDFGSNTNQYMFLAPKHGGNGFVYFGITLNSYNNEEGIVTTVSPTVGEWFHVAVTLEGSTAILYIDGVEINRNENMTLNPQSLGLTTQNYIGKSQWPDPYLDGIVDEFRIYNRALDATEVYNLMTTTLSTESPILSTQSEYIFFCKENTLNVINHSNTPRPYSIHSIEGKLVTEGEISNKGITPLGTFKTGIYIVNINNNEKTISTKVMVQ